MLQHLAHARSLTVSELAKPLQIALPTVLKHLGVLERANLVCRRKTGRTVTITLAPAGMADAMAWLQRTEAFWTTRLDRLANAIPAAHSYKRDPPKEKSS